MPIWTDAVTNAIKRHIARTGSPLFTRQELIAAEEATMLKETGTTGRTPTQTMGRELQQLRDAGLLEFRERGIYRWIGELPDLEPARRSNGVFVTGLNSAYRDRPELYYRFPPQWLRNASCVVGHWIIYQEPRRSGGRGYHAVAKVERIDRDPDDETMYLARIARGTYLEFGRPVPFHREGKPVERGLLNPDGRLNNGRAVQSIRPISEDDFNRIVDLGLVEEDELLPRVDDDEPIAPLLTEERSPWEGPVDRPTALVNRTVRDRQFRARVLDVYGSRCALTGMKLINGGGRAETQAAHIMSVEAGGPDAVDNGIALSGTIHWMFDRGLISLSDNGEILLSRAINDIESVERLIYPDRQARLPRATADRPRPEYLHWHRTECFHD